MAKKNFYAIKVGKGVKNKIVQSWDECKEIITGFNSTYKGFATIEEAEEYLGISKNKELEETKIKFQKAKTFDPIEIDKFEGEYVYDKTIHNKPNGKKKKRKGYTSLKDVEIPNDLYMLFEQKCKKLNMDQSNIIKELLKEWLL